MADRFLFEPLDVVQLAAPGIDNIDLDLTARNIRIFRASGSKRSYNPVVAHAEGFASGATTLQLALAEFDGVEPDWWKRHLRAGDRGSPCDASEQWVDLDTPRPEAAGGV